MTALSTLDRPDPTTAVDTAPPLAAEPAPASPSPATRPPRRWHSSELLGAAQEVEISHGATVYRLRRTGLGKLILTK